MAGRVVHDNLAAGPLRLGARSNASPAAFEERPVHRGWSIPHFEARTAVQPFSLSAAARSATTARAAD